MKIGIDARFFGPGGKGLGRYSQKLVEELEKVDYANQYVVFLTKENWDLYQPKNPNFKKALADVRWYTLDEQLQMPKILNKYNLDLVHFLHFNVPVMYRKPFVVTIHDLILLEYPTRKASKLGTVMYWIKNFAYRRVISFAARGSERVIAISEYTKQAVMRQFGITESKVDMIYEGVDLEKFNPVNKEPFDFEKVGVEKGNYLMYVGNAYPHKNIDGLIRGFQELIGREGIDPNLKLVIVGKTDYFFQQLIDLANELGLSDRIVFPGFVPDEEMIDLFENTAAYVFPSFYEGFGLPPLEAMAMGAPILLSNRTCLPEIFGESAEYFDPGNSGELVDAMERMLKDPSIAERQKQFIEPTLAKYSWEQMAKETVDVYNKSVK